MYPLVRFLKDKVYWVQKFASIALHHEELLQMEVGPDMFQPIACNCMNP